MAWETELDRRIAEELPALSWASNEPMARHTSFHIGGPARRMAFPDHAEEAAALARLAEQCGARPLVIGNGTNLLAPDEGLDRLVINTSRGMLRMTEEDGTVTAESGVSLARLAEFARRHGLAGLEFAHGIPGSLGGAVCMNAGAYGGEMKNLLAGASVWDPAAGTIRELDAAALALSYRHSVISEHPEYVVLRAVLRLTPDDPEAIGARMRAFAAKRRASQPLEWPSAGSVFKRPEGHFAGALIEQCGLRGAREGGAMVSEKHAGFIINTGGATAGDVRALIGRIQRTVFEATGVMLEPEVRLLG